MIFASRNGTRITVIHEGRTSNSKTLLFRGADGLDPDRICIDLCKNLYISLEYIFIGGGIRYSHKTTEVFINPRLNRTAHQCSYL